MSAWPPVRAADLETRASLVRMSGPGAVLDVWLGDAAASSTLEADVRAVSAAGTRRLSALAVALGDVARRHKLEVRIIPRIGADGPSVLVLFGPRATRTR